ncbi:MAG: hypothetical protein KAJ19_07220 [Gammaproteobacteria bacterium]|nr:hypothetical protein [Gammaproteobacteria bacterium]
MAEKKELEIKIEWQNDAFFEMTAKEPQKEWREVIRFQENGYITDLFEFAESMANTYMQKSMSAIKTEMLTKDTEEA